MWGKLKAHLTCPKTTRKSFFNHLKQEVDLFSRGAYQTVKPLQPLRPVLQNEQGVFFTILPVKHRAGPGPHAALDLLQVVLGPLEPALQVTDGVSHFMDILPNVWRGVVGMGGWDVKRLEKKKTGKLKLEWECVIKTLKSPKNVWRQGPKKVF